MKQHKNDRSELLYPIITTMKELKERNLNIELPVTAALALLFGFCLAAGNMLDGGGYLGYGVEDAATNVYINWLSPEIYLSTLLYALAAFALLMLLWRGLDWLSAWHAFKLHKKGALVKETPDTAAESTYGTLNIKIRWFWLCALLLLLCWSIYWLAVWPGIFNYDGYYQHEMIKNESLQTHHPILHTLLLNGFLYFGMEALGSFNTGLALFIGFGLIVSALAFSWMLYTMAEEGAGKVLLACSILFLINPSFALWLLSTNKDVLFTAVLLLAALILYRNCRFKTNGSIPHISAITGIALFLLVLAVLALRTSAVYSFIVFLPFAALLIRKHLRVRLVSILVGATGIFVILYLLLTQIIFQIPSGPWQTLDALSIPRQQLARVWMLTEDPAEIAAFEELFSDEDLEKLSEYQADNADSSRAAYRTVFYENTAELTELYFAMGASHAGAYFDAALLTTYEAWCPGAVVDGYVLEGNFSRPGEARGGYLDVSTFSPGEEAWILEDFGKWLRSFALGNEGLDNALVRLLCSPAAYMWLLLIVFVRCICVRNRRAALVCTLLLVFGLTALLSPLVVPRYYLMVIAATPLLLHLAVSPSWKAIAVTSEN